MVSKEMLHQTWQIKKMVKSIRYVDQNSIASVFYDYRNVFEFQLDNIFICNIYAGSHSIGQARCQNFRNRIYNEANINTAYATSLKANCPTSGGNNNLAALDSGSATSFDSSYFTNLISQKGLLHSDQVLFNNGSTDAQVTAYSTNQATFLSDFANAMVKMGNLSPLTGTSGQIRKNCRKTN